jgi:hypothetical protein
MRVLEIGSGGLNAAYLAELVGTDGEVTTVDIDPLVTDRVRRLLDERGYGRVDVVTADAAEPIPGLRPLDVVITSPATSGEDPKTPSAQAHWHPSREYQRPPRLSITNECETGPMTVQTPKGGAHRY